jgi:hypothetical protein
MDIARRVSLIVGPGRVRGTHQFMARAKRPGSRRFHLNVGRLPDR